MRFSNILKKSFCLTQAGGLFFSCQALAVDAGNINEEFLENHIKNAAMVLTKVRILKKLVSANILNGSYSMIDRYADKSKARNFSDFLNDLEKALVSCFSALKQLNLEFDEEEYLAAIQKDSKLKTKEDFCRKKIKDASGKEFNLKDEFRVRELFLPVSIRAKKDRKLISRLDDIIDLVGESLKGSSFESINVDDLMKSIEQKDESYLKVDDMLKIFKTVENGASDFSKAINFLEVFAGKEENTEIFSLLGNQNFINSDDNKNKVAEAFFYFYKRQKGIKDVARVNAEKKKEREEREEKNRILEEIKNMLFSCGKKVCCLNFLADRDIFNKEYSTGVSFNLKTRGKGSEKFTAGEFIAVLNEACSDALHQYFSCFEENPLGGIKVKDKIDINIGEFLKITKEIKMSVDEVFKIFSMVLFFSLDIAKDNIERDIATSIIFELINERVLLSEEIGNSKLYHISEYFKNCNSSGNLFTYLEKLGEVPSVLNESKKSSFKSDAARVKYLQESLQKLQSVFFDGIFLKKIDSKKAFFEESFGEFFDLYRKTFSVECWRRLLLIRNFVKEDDPKKDTNAENLGEAIVRLKEEKFNRVLSFAAEDGKGELLNKKYKTRKSNGQIRYLVPRTVFNDVLVGSVCDAISKCCNVLGLAGALEDFSKNTDIPVPDVTDIEKKIYGKCEENSKNTEQLKFKILSRNTAEEYMRLLLDIDDYLNAKEQERKKVTSPKLLGVFSKMVNIVANKC